ncbi:MAG TPA: bifunctional homocysteine S-methyltransferase/methylenetetrahydrofolate reductase [Acidimicrobiales bacterium]
MDKGPKRDQRRWLDAELGSRVLVCDGAMGTMLHAAGASLDRWLPEMNLTQPATVSEVHRAYVEAGADIIETNTFGANTVTMNRFGLKADIALINRRAVELARAAAASPEHNVLVAGSVAPAAAPLSPGRVPDIEAHEALLEQVAALESAGVDLLMFETFGDLGALAALISAYPTQVPIVAHVTFLEDGRTIGGDSPERVGDVLGELGVVAIGANCALGPRGMRPIVEALAHANSLPLSVQPNAGPPSIVRGRFEYRRNEEYFARLANIFVDLGASIVGGCCGTTPRHIEAIVNQLRATRPALEVPGVAATSTRRRHDISRSETSARTFAERLSSNEFIVAAEIAPPKACDVEATLAGAAALSQAGAQTLLVTATPGAREAISPISFGLLLQERLGVDVVLSAATWEKSLLGLQADLLGAHALGLRSVVCTTGVPPPQGDYPDLSRVFEVSSIDLIETLLGLNQSSNERGSRARASTSFVIGARVNPAAADRDFELDRALQKLEAGVDFFVTDPLFSLEELERFVAALRQRGSQVPVLLGVTPIRDFEHAEYLHFEVPGVTVPDEVLERMRAAGSHGAEVGRAITTELVWQAARTAHGVLVVPGETRDADAVELLKTFVGLGGLEVANTSTEMDALSQSH